VPFAYQKYSYETAATITLCQARYEAFGSAGYAGKIKVVPLREIARLT
jgi:fructose-bisphosphate aldolase class II